MNDAQRYENIVKRAQRVLDIASHMAKGNIQLENTIYEMQLHFNGYAGENNNVLIATGNWNKVYKFNPATRTQSVISDLPTRVGNIFEKMSIEIEWSDEWSECCECRGLIRTKPDSYSWTPNFKYIEGVGDTCHECLLKDPEESLSYLEDNPRDANTIDSIDPADHGYVKFNDESYHTGYNGISPTPSTIAEYMHARGIYRYLFAIDSSSQFNYEWSVYIHKDEVHLFEDDPSADEPDEYMNALTQSVMSSGLSEEIDKLVTSDDVKRATQKLEQIFQDLRAITPEVSNVVVDCHTCGRENDSGITECWWCGQHPEEK